MPVLLGADVFAQKGVLVPKLLTGLVEWQFSHSQIALSGTPKLVAKWAGTGHPGVCSTQVSEQTKGKRYCEVATTGWEMSFGVGNDLRPLGTGQPFGLHAFDDVWAWGIQTQSNGTLRTLHNGVATQREAYTYVPDAPLQIALDFDTGNLWLGYNNQWAGGGDPAVGTLPTYTGVTGFPRKVAIYGTMGGNVTFPQSDTAVLHATENNQVMRPAGFMPWQDTEGAPNIVELVGTTLPVQRNTFGVHVFVDPHVSISLTGLPVSVMRGGLGFSRDRQIVTWNPNDKSPLIDLTDGNLGATTRSAGLSNHITYTGRATLGRAINSGKYYFEVTVPYAEIYSGGFSHGAGIGISQFEGLTGQAEDTDWGGLVRWDWDDSSGGYRRRESSFNLAVDYPGDLDSELGYGRGYEWLPNEFVPNRVLQMAIDFNLGYVWIGYHGKWFNSGRTGSNPATGDAPLYNNIKNVIPTDRNASHPSIGPNYTPGQPTPPSSIGHFSRKSFAFEPPAGFKPWEDDDPLEHVSWLTAQSLAVQGCGKFAVLTDDGIFVELCGQAATVRQAQLKFSKDPVGQQMVVQQGALGLSKSMALVGTQLTLRFYGPVVSGDGFVVVPLQGHECKVERGNISYRIRHRVEFIRNQLPLQIFANGVPEVNYARIPGGLLRDEPDLNPRQGPLGEEDWVAAATNGEVLFWPGNRRSFQIASSLFTFWDDFHHIIRVGLCFASDALDDLAADLLAVTMHSDRIPIGKDVTVAVVGGVSQRFENPIAGTKGYRVQVAVDLTAVAENGRWGAYWVGFVDTHKETIPGDPVPDRLWDVDKQHWLTQGVGTAAVGGDPLDGQPLGYLFDPGFVPSSPLVIRVWEDARTDGWEGSEATLCAARSAHSVESTWTTNTPHIPVGFIAWDEEAPTEWAIRLKSTQLSAFWSQFPNLIPQLLVGPQATVQQGAVVPALYVELIGVQVSVQQGTVVPSPTLLGQSMTVQRGAVVGFLGRELLGRSVTVQRGAFGVTLTIPMTGQQALVNRGIFVGVGVGVVLTGQQAATAFGSLAVELGATLTGRAATAQLGTLAKGLSLVLVGREATVIGGTLYNGLVRPLLGRSVGLSRGVFRTTVGWRLAGQQLAVEQGVPGLQLDAIVPLRGMQLTVQLGELPIKPVPPDWQLWVQQPSADLFVEEEPVE